MTSFVEIAIGRHIWMKDDLAVTVGRNGKSILHADSNEQWSHALSVGLPAYRFSRIEGVGLLYNVHSLRDIAPAGWEIPGKDAWEDLTRAVSENTSRLDEFRFAQRVARGYFSDASREDNDSAGYWQSEFTMNESWGAHVATLGVTIYAGCTCWGCICNYGLFVRCVRSA